jgi:GPH family glycoside/pentoside/hexuronide:cation symporter
MTENRAPAISRTQLICYGLAELGLQMPVAAVSFLMIFYTDVAGLGILAAGLVVGASKVWDALNDPLMGYLSDHTRARAGRRRFWFPVAAAPTWLFVWLAFAPPAALGPVALCAWMLVTAMAVDLCLTIFMSPYYALGAELSDDPALRTRIVAVRTFFSYIGALIGAGMLGLAPLFGAGRAGWGRVALFYGCAATVFMLVAFFGTREPERPASPQGPSLADFVAGLRSSLSNPPFRVLVATFLVMSVGAGINSATTIYALRYWLELSPDEAGRAVLIFVVAATLVLPFWSWIGRRLGKDVVLKALCIYEVFILGAVYFLAPERSIFFTFLVFSGVGFSGFIILVSLLADVLDHDEWTTGLQRGGAFFGFWTLATKIAYGIGPPLVGFVLDGLDYLPNQEQSPRVIEALKLLWGPIPALFFAGAAVLCWRFPLTRDEHERVQRELALRRASQVRRRGAATFSASGARAP